LLGKKGYVVVVVVAAALVIMVLIKLYLSSASEIDVQLIIC
jgi:hypothetical protein